MADRYAQQQVGVADGTQTPKAKLDGRQVGAHIRIITASKVPGVAWASGDRIYLGRKKAHEKLVRVDANTDTSFGTATLDLGDGTTAGKFLTGKTVTATDTPTPIGPRASIRDDDPLTTDEDLWLTIGVVAIASGTLATFDIYLSGA